MEILVRRLSLAVAGGKDSYRFDERRVVRTLEIHGMPRRPQTAHTFRRVIDVSHTDRSLGDRWFGRVTRLFVRKG